jgi:hypothetical protein
VILTLAARHGYISPDPLTPGVLLLSLGLYIALEPLDFPTHDYFYELANSLRLTAVALGIWAARCSIARIATGARRTNWRRLPYCQTNGADDQTVCI